MCKVIVFAGTTEGREIAEFLAKKRVPAHICVATEYGEELLPKGEFLEVSHRRLEEAQMKALIEEKKALCVIDATHPYAAKVTENIRTACRETGCEYLRVLRENEKGESGGDWAYADSVEEAAELLNHIQGNVLVTTGSKEAAKYTAVSGYQERVFLRILSVPEAVSQCRELGFPGRNLICMQGPFSKEMNCAMLRQFDCRCLVTKMSGTAGGFLEKIEAAQECGCRLIVIGRPVKEEGVSVKEAKRLLRKKFCLPAKRQIALVGIGMGDRKSRTLEAEETIRGAELLIGARRMADACDLEGKDSLIEYDSEKIAAYLREHEEYEKIAVVLSGDVGFYSGAKKLLSALEGLGEVRLVCGISSAVYFMSKIGLSWDDARLVSSHGREENLPYLVKHCPKVFSILGTRDGIALLAKKLLEYGLGQVKLYVGENLSYENERILEGVPEDFIRTEVSPLSVVCIVNKKAEGMAATHGISDSRFIRDKVPMTKEEVRAVSLAKLRLKEDSVCWDVGAGTGSVSVEMALRAFRGRVYAIEKKAEAVGLLEKNKKAFQADNLSIVQGEAPEALKDLEAPTHGFIGGSSGNMKEIVKCLLEKNPGVRIVINCIALESVSEALDCLKSFPVKDTEVIQVAVSRGKAVGRYHMMTGENPIYILSCTGACEG